MGGMVTTVLMSAPALEMAVIQSLENVFVLLEKRDQSVILTVLPEGGELDV